MLAIAPMAKVVRVTASGARPAGMSPEEEAAARENGAVEVEAGYSKP